VAEGSSRKELWLSRRAEILEEAGRLEDARKAFLEALAAIGRLPAHLKSTRSTRELESRARGWLDERARRDEQGRALSKQ
jgi:hypothetical protein